MQEGAADPSTLFVAHPFTPVYLLPLAEIVPSSKSDTQIIEAAKEVLREIGMFPLHVRKEIDAHIAAVGRRLDAAELAKVDRLTR